MNVLVIDIGGSRVKILATGQKQRRVLESGPTMTPQAMVAGVRKLAADWKYAVVSIGYPGKVRHNRVLAEPHNLGKGWVGFNFKAAFRRPVKVINDAAMQALGSYRRGTMLFLGFGTGLGSALVVEGVVVPMELAHLSYKKGTYEDYLGLRGLKRLGKKKWRKLVTSCVERLIPALQLDDVVLGGGNVKKLKKLPKGCRAGANANAFMGGFRLWAREGRPAPRARTRAPAKRARRRAVGQSLRPPAPATVGDTASAPAAVTPEANANEGHPTAS
jgi:predicted NBD/HSP70 family sugar kinase